MDKLCLTAVTLLAVFSLIGAYPISSRQFLPYRPGYVPVYIRNGDTPLEDINLELAEAFHAIPSGRSAGRTNDIKAARSDDDSNNVIIPVQVIAFPLPQPSVPAKEKSREIKPDEAPAVVESEKKSETPVKSQENEENKLKNKKHGSKPVQDKKNPKIQTQE